METVYYSNDLRSYTKIIRLSFICISSCEGEDLEKNNVKKSTPGNTACAVQ